MDFLSLAFGFGGGRRRQTKKKKAKAKKENWYERLTVDELKQICRAATLPVTGTKKVIIGRLIGNESTNDYAWEGRYVGTTMDTLKQRCKDRNLVQSGTKLSLVLRIVQHDHKSAPEATAAATKRPAPPASADGPPKKKRKPAKPNLDKIHERVLKKIESCRQKKYQSHYGSKCHAPDLYSFIASTIRKECIDKKYIETEPLFALDIAESALVCLKDNFDSIVRPGYDEGSIESFSSDLKRILVAAKPVMDDDKRRATLDWIVGLEAKLEPYGLGEAFYGTREEGEDARYLLNVIKILEDNNDVVEEEAESLKNAEDN